MIDFSTLTFRNSIFDLGEFPGEKEFKEGLKAQTLRSGRFPCFAGIRLVQTAGGKVPSDLGVSHATAARQTGRGIVSGHGIE